MFFQGYCWVFPDWVGQQFTQWVCNFLDFKDKTLINLANKYVACQSDSLVCRSKGTTAPMKPNQTVDNLDKTAAKTE